MHTYKYGVMRSLLLQVSRQPRTIVAVIAAGFALGVGYRAIFEPLAEASLQNYLLSAVHGVGLALVILLVQTAFASSARSPFGEALRRLPLAAEVLARTVVMTAALVVAGLALQFILYAESLHLAWISRHWFTVELPRIVASAFALSLLIGIANEAARLIGGPLLTSVVLGTYHRPVRRNLIVMFLDLAQSTHLAEALGELRVHDLITQFFYDIDEPIAAHDGTVHAYVGDEVIVTWMVSDDPGLNARAISCYFAIEDRVEALRSRYLDQFGVVPSFRAGLHTGPVVISECGAAKRQLALFGDTMNVTARLCDYGKTAHVRLVISDDLVRIAALVDLPASTKKRIELRGRQEPLDALMVGAA